METKIKTEKTNKEALAELINTIQGDAQGIYFKLDAFSEYDNGSIAQDTVIKLMDELTTIRRNILKKPSDINNSEQPEG